MALVVADRVRVQSTSSGTGSFSLGAAFTGYTTFSATVADGDTVYYCIHNLDNGVDNEWEVGLGTYTLSTDTLVRTTVLSNYLGTTATVNFSAGTKEVFITQPAEKAVFEDASGNVSGYPIVGGSINNTPIGATTQNTGNFTTLGAQTATLRGTGQNLFTFSNTFTNAIWSQSNVTVATTTATTDPFGGLNAYIITSTVTSSAGISNNVTLATNTYTVSIFAKAGTCNFLRFVGVASGFPTAWFNLSTGTVGTVQSGITAASIQSIGNGWYRCSITSTGSAIPLFRLSDTDNNSNVSFGSNIYFYGAQIEIGPVTNTYIPTTTTAIYGTPTLSFSGASNIGLQSDGSLFVQPAGSGAIQAQATTSSTVGGNARGTNAVDWQTVRGTAGQVASGIQSAIGGGTNNTASGSLSVIAGGGFSATSGQYASIGGGAANNASQYGAAVGGGQGNAATGWFNFIGGGFTNSGTATAAVTTQATTSVTSGSTAVTLSGSNANIRVGQLITGTGISTPTYVAAISGTSLTLSQNANATGTPTLSFFTPHGVVVGGGNNQATGAYSFIGGGGDAGTAANRNVASGDWSVVCGGATNTASATGSFVGGGGVSGGILGPNTASGTTSVVTGGFANTASGVGSLVSGGTQNVANSTRGSVLGGRYGNTRSINGIAVISACDVPIASASVSQSAILIIARQTTDATATILTSDTGAAGTTNQIILPNNSAYYFKGSVIANVTGAANGAAWSIEGAIMRGANAASTVLIDTPSVNRVAASSGALAWSVALAADTSNGGLRVTVTGAAATTIRWVCKIETTEVTF